MSTPLAQRGGVSVGVTELVLESKLGAGRELVRQILLRKFAAKVAEENGIQLDEQQVDAAVADWRAEQDLFSDEAFDAWLNGTGVTLEQLRAWLGERLLSDALGAAWAGDEVIRQSFQSRLYDFAVVHVHSIELPNAGAAAEVALQLREGETTWEQAAVVAGGMESQDLLRRDAPEDAAAALFSADPGAIVGPVEIEEGQHVVYRVVLRTPPRLDEATRARIQSELFVERLLAELNRRPQ